MRRSRMITVPQPGTSFSLLLLSVCLLGTGCAHQPFVASDQLTACQSRTTELYAENQELQSAAASSRMMIEGLQNEQLVLSEQLGSLNQQLATSQQRIDNLLAEREQLRAEAESALTAADGGLFVGRGPDLPGFTSDPLTGLQRFRSTVLFDLGKDVLRPEAIPILKSFASEVTGPLQADLRILVVGHTDEVAIVRPETRVQHPTNWHLSTDRANAVIEELTRLGVAPERIAAMGYSEFQPLELSPDEEARQRNRRVELFLIPAGSEVAAQWDPARSIR